MMIMYLGNIEILMEKFYLIMTEKYWAIVQSTVFQRKEPPSSEEVLFNMLYCLILT